MWNRRRPASGRAPGRGKSLTPALGAGQAAPLDPASLLESYFPASVEEHPAKRRMRRANQLTEEMRQTGGRHRRED